MLGNKSAIFWRLAALCLSSLFLFVGCAHILETRRNLIHATGLEKVFYNFHTVQADALYRSAQLSPSFLKLMIKKLNIKTVINLRGINKHKKWWQREDRLLRLLGIKFYNISMSALHLPDKKNLLQLLQIYKDAERPILIHCSAGADRTGEAAALWLLEEQKKNKNIAIQQLSIKYGHLRFKYPAKRFFINLWQGKGWLIKKYNPLCYDQFSNNA
jgi:protein tyrosine/serine phosphatase